MTGNYRAIFIILLSFLNVSKWTCHILNLECLIKVEKYTYIVLHLLISSVQSTQHAFQHHHEILVWKA